MKVDQLSVAVRLRDKLNELQRDLEHVKEGRVSVRHSQGGRLELYKGDEVDAAFNKAIQALMVQRMEHQIELVISDLKALGISL